MNRFKNILFVLHNDEIPQHALNHACSLADANGANLTILALHPAFPKELEQMTDEFTDGMRSKIEQAVEASGTSVKHEVNFESKTPYVVTIVNHVQRGKYDIVFKEAEPLGKGIKRGFRSLDMDLLRKCPCPVWVNRPSQNGTPKILIAVDPLNDDPAGYDLGIALLQIGTSLAARLNTTAKVVSCWEFEYEGYLRHAPFARMDPARVDNMVAEAEKHHKDALDELIAKAKLETEPPPIACLHGKPDDQIPSYIEENGMDLLVMGTVGRTGVPGFFVGNTAENVLLSLNCAMVAIKPNGFVSPIKA